MPRRGPPRTTGGGEPGHQTGHQQAPVESSGGGVELVWTPIPRVWFGTQDVACERVWATSVDPRRRPAPALLLPLARLPLPPDAGGVAGGDLQVHAAVARGVRADGRTPLKEALPALMDLGS